MFSVVWVLAIRGFGGCELPECVFAPVYARFNWIPDDRVVGLTVDWLTGGIC